MSGEAEAEGETRQVNLPAETRQVLDRAFQERQALRGVVRERLFQSLEGRLSSGQMRQVVAGVGLLDVWTQSGAQVVPGSERDVVSIYPFLRLLQQAEGLEVSALLQQQEVEEAFHDPHLNLAEEASYEQRAGQMLRLLLGPSRQYQRAGGKLNNAFQLPQAAEFWLDNIGRLPERERISVLAYNPGDSRRANLARIRHNLPKLDIDEVDFTSLSFSSFPGLLPVGWAEHQLDTIEGLPSK